MVNLSQQKRLAASVAGVGKRKSEYLWAKCDKMDWKNLPGSRER
jgi:ribosomal protein L19E